MTRKPPDIRAYEAGRLDGFCTGCSAEDDVTVLKVTPFHGNMSLKSQYCQTCLKMVVDVLTRQLKETS